jgi:hypothetical protein
MFGTRVVLRKRLGSRDLEFLFPSTGFLMPVEGRRDRWEG